MALLSKHNATKVRPSVIRFGGKRLRDENGKGTMGCGTGMRLLGVGWECEEKGEGTISENNVRIIQDH